MNSQITPRGLLDIDAFFIPRAMVRKTVRFLQRVGNHGAEGFVLWGGVRDEERNFRFTATIIPDQQAMLTESGLLVTVAGDELFRINKQLHRNGQVLAAQVHSHPTAAYHSRTDDRYPLVTLLGALSVVVPDFARHAPGDLSAWAWYRLREYGHWVPLTDKTRLILE